MAKPGGEMQSVYARRTSRRWVDRVRRALEPPRPSAAMRIFCPEAPQLSSTFPFGGTRPDASGAIRVMCRLLSSAQGPLAQWKHPLHQTQGAAQQAHIHIGAVEAVEG